MTYNLGTKERPGEARQTLPPGLTELPERTKERLVPQYCIFLIPASKHIGWLRLEAA